MKLKKRMMFALSLILLVLLVSPIYAHSTSQEGVLAKTYHSEYGGLYIGGEDVGWSIDESLHTNGTDITYSFDTTDSYLTSIYKNYTTEGASKWSGIVTISNKTDGTGVGTVKTYYDGNSGTVARFKSAESNIDGHLTTWTIEMNRAKNISSTTMAHEFGHVIGLNDLYESQNQNKLMYGYSSRTVSSPTSLDIWGAKVIIGVHSSHTWRYKFYDITSTGNRHVNYCASCNGVGINMLKCTYNINNVCMLCGTPQAGMPKD